MQIIPCLGDTSAIIPDVILHPVYIVVVNSKQKCCELWKTKDISDDVIQWMLSNGQVYMIGEIY